MTSVADETKVGDFQEVIRVDREQLRGHLREMVPLETEIIERCRRKESSVEESLTQMYLAGVSVRRVEDITEALWGRVSVPAPSVHGHGTIARTGPGEPDAKSRIIVTTGLPLGGGAVVLNQSEMEILDRSG